MIRVVAFSNGFFVSDTEDSRFNFEIFTDGQDPKSSYRSMVFWDKFKDRAIKAVEDFNNNICPNCGGALEVSRGYRAPSCSGCRKEDSQLRRLWNKNYKSYHGPFPAISRYPDGYFFEWEILSEGSIGVKLNKAIFAFNGYPISSSFNWFFKNNVIKPGESNPIRLQLGTFLFKAELKFNAIFWEESFGKIIQEKFGDLYNLFVNNPKPMKIVSDNELPKIIFTLTDQDDVYLVSFLKQPDGDDISESSNANIDDIKKALPSQYYSDRLTKQIIQSKSDDRKKRLARLKKAPKKPSIILVYTQQYLRNPDVIVEVLNRAAGLCEECGRPAPFIRASDGTPYLEVHHKIPLSKDGEDTVENTVALCPNCHRKFHFG